MWPFWPNHHAVAALEPLPVEPTPATFQSKRDAFLQDARDLPLFNPLTERRYGAAFEGGSGTRGARVSVSM
jgi:hypothetical protein